MVITVTLAYGLTPDPAVPGSRVILLILVLFTMLFTAGIIPNYLLVKQLGLLDTYAALILPGADQRLQPGGDAQLLHEHPAGAARRARIDGASELQILCRIVLPLSKAVLAVIALFYAVGYWNTFFNACST